MKQSKKPKKFEIKNMPLVFPLLLSLFLGTTISLQSSAQSEKSSSATRIEIDEDKHTIKFYIKNNPVALLNEDGLHVIRDIKYGGTIKDVGSDVIKADIQNTAGQ